uniref:Uncharacterized protein n=1 Tax=Strigamia maritima TaxID=126957 RepID=T1JJP3_STRMM
MLSAYMRFKYPHIIDGAIAASAPVYLVAGLDARDTFFPAVTKDFSDVSPLCAQQVQSAFSIVSSLAQQGTEGLLEISRDFKLCSPLKNDTDFKHLLMWARNAFVSLAMMDYPYPTNFMAKLPAFPVKVACTKMADAKTTVEGLKDIAGMIYNGSGDSTCNDIWTQFVECADPTGCGLGNDAAAWDFQACTEIILPEGTNNKTDFFPELPFTLEQRAIYCRNKWGVEPRNDWLATQFFIKGLKGASNIVFSNGNLDPWKNGGVLGSIGQSIIAVPVIGGAHHLDLRGHNPADPPMVIKARATEITYIGKWIKNNIF